jgi:predicted nucleic acid-binding protein
MSQQPRPVVVDTSVVVKWFFSENHHSQALQIRDDARSGRVKLHAPDLIYAEFTNVVWKRVTFQGLDPDDGALIVATFKLIPIEITPSVDLVEKAFLLGTQHKRAIYDDLFLALSLQITSLFVTGDQKLYNSLHSAFPNIVWIGDWM